MTPSQNLSYDSKHYVTHQELTEFLVQASQVYQDICELSSLAKTDEGRDIWLLTMTNKKTGQPLLKPGLWIDANIHAVEVASTQACLHTIHFILTNYTTDKELRDLVDHQTLYFIPRISPDGAERVVATPEFMRSKPQVYPHKESTPGFYPKDINQDQFIGLMRKKDPTGPWKISALDSRIMTLRRPDENQNSDIYYRLFIEGESGPIETQEITPRSRYGIDLNRQFPFDWAPEKMQMGSGPYPLSEVESQCIMRALEDRPNIYAMLSLHTFSRVIIRPLTNEPDSHLPSQDLEVFKHLEKRAAEVSSYPTVSGYHGFKYDPKNKLHGGLMDWAYGIKGIFANVVEIWHLAQEAGIKPGNLVDWLLEPIDDSEMIQILKWCDQNLEKGSYFKNWEPFDHHQLGEVELGGWKTKFTWSNPPSQYLPSEMDKIKNLILFYGKIAPRIIVEQQKVTLVGTTSDDKKIHKIEVTIANCGFLSSSGSAKAIEMGATRNPRVEFKSQDLDIGSQSGPQILSGPQSEEFQHLMGRSHLGLLKNMVVSHLFGTTTPSRHTASFTWIVTGSGSCEVKISFERANSLLIPFQLP